MGFTMRDASVPLGTAAPLPSEISPRGVPVRTLAIPTSLARLASLGAASGKLPLAPSTAGEDPQVEASGSLGTPSSGFIHSLQRHASATPITATAESMHRATMRMDILDTSSFAKQVDVVIKANFAAQVIRIKRLG